MLLEAGAAHPATFELQASAPGLAGSVAVVGSAAVSLDQPRLGLTVQADGLDLTPLAPYLAAAGLAPASRTARPTWPSTRR